MRAYEFITEALKPSQYRNLVKGWDSERLADAFRQWPEKKNRTATRLYFDFPQTRTEIEPDTQVVDLLKQLGYEVVDYVQGLAKKIGSNQNATKIGKILSAAVSQGNNEASTILQKFQKDPARAAMKTYQGVVSRHPYDVAGMSTGRGWTSCQDLVKGSACEYVPRDIKAGTLVAYMIQTNDLDIKHPAGRILLKPYINDKKQTAYAPHKETYGTITAEFEQAVAKFASWLNNQTGVTGSFVMDPTVYGGKDRLQLTIIPPNSTKQQLIDLLKQDPTDIRYMLDEPFRDKVDDKMLQMAVAKAPWVIRYVLDAGITPSEQVQLAAVTNNSHIIHYIIKAKIKPSEEIQLAAVTRYGLAIEYIIDAGITPSEQVQLSAVTNDGDVIGHITNAGIKPSEQVQLAAVANDRKAIGYIFHAGITPSEQVQLAAVANNGLAIGRIINAGIKPSEQVQLAAVTNDGGSIRHIIGAGKIKPSEQVQLAAVANDGLAIGHITNAGITPSEQVQLAAVTNDGRAIYYITNAGITPSEQVQLAAVANNGESIKYIISAGIKPSDRVQRAARKAT